MNNYIFILLLVLGIIYLFKILVEPIYVFVFKKPLYVHFYFTLKKIDFYSKAILEENFDFYKKLHPKNKKYFEHRVVNFISNYSFFGKENLKITKEIKILIAVSSTMLTFGMRNYLYTVFDKIIVYPNAYYSTLNNANHKGEFNPKLKVIVFSWSDFKDGLIKKEDNYNLGLHEFAHALLFESQKEKKSKNSRVSFDIFSDNFFEIKKIIEQPENLKSILAQKYFRDYAFTNSVEFIAVILEYFFETPDQFKQEFPDLFDKVKKMINYNEKYFS